VPARSLVLLERPRARVPAQIASSLPAGGIFSAFSYQVILRENHSRGDLRRAERSALQLHPRAAFAMIPE
jgi:hypothetical protein